MECTIYVAKTKALISCAVTAQLICAFVFAYAKKNQFFHDTAHMVLPTFFCFAGDYRNLFKRSQNKEFFSGSFIVVAGKSK